MMPRVHVEGAESAPASLGFLDWLAVGAIVACFTYVGIGLLVLGGAR